jgi:hypothetical protein
LIAKNRTDCRVICTGFTNPLNNGTFNVKDSFYFGGANSDRYCKIFNPNCVSQVNLTGASWSFQRKYTIAVWAHNVSGNSWNVEVDPGDGSYISVGSIPVDAGGWRLYFFHFWAVSTGSRYIRITDPTGGNTLYIDGILVFHSALEFAPANVYGTDGILTNPDRFSTGGSYTAGLADVGKFLFVWDEINNKNTGYYKILADLGGGIVQVDMRSATHTFVSTTIPANPLNWRIVDVVAQAHNDASPAFQESMGFGLKSPHSSGWRYFQRASNTFYTKTSHVWSAPDDEATFNWSTGQFYQDGPSTQRSLASQYTYDTYVNNQNWTGMYLAGGNFQTRDWFMTDEDRSFVSFIHMQAVTFGQHACFFVGYAGADPDHPDIEEFVSEVQWNTVSYADIAWSAFNNAFAYNGITFDPDGIARTCSFEVLGYGVSSAYLYGLTNAGPNPWSGREWLTPMIVVRDPTGLSAYSSERDSDCGLFMCRTNMANMVTFDSGNYLHFVSALCWEWSGEAIV